MKENSPPRPHGWLTVVLDAVIAGLFPSFASKILILFQLQGATLLGVLLAIQLITFHLIGRVRGRPGLALHLSKVVLLVALLVLVLRKDQDWLLNVLVLAACAALGGWTGSRR